MYTIHVNTNVFAYTYPFYHQCLQFHQCPRISIKRTLLLAMVPWLVKVQISMASFCSKFTIHSLRMMEPSCSIQERIWSQTRAYFTPIHSASECLCIWDQVQLIKSKTKAVYFTIINAPIVEIKSNFPDFELTCYSEDEFCYAGTIISINLRDWFNS